MSAATHLYQLFADEDALQLAAVAILTAAGLTPAYTRGDKAALTDAGYLVKATRGAATGDMQQIPATALAAISRRTEYTRYTAELEIIVTVSRPANTLLTGLPGVRTLLDQRVGQVRAAFLRCVLPFTEANLPWHEVSDILPGPAEWGVDEEQDLDVCRLRWTLSYAIRRTAWPLAATP